MGTRNQLLGVLRKNYGLSVFCTLIGLQATSGSHCHAVAVPVDLSSGASNNLALTLKAIRSAKKSLYLNIYELTSTEVADALEKTIQRGVRVDILQEGQPVGGLSQAGRTIQNRLVEAMQKANPNNRFYEMTSKAYVEDPDDLTINSLYLLSRGTKSVRRFRFNHAKYALVDGSNLLIGSENYSPGGQAIPPGLGNRGWQVFVKDKALTKEFHTLFQSDSDLSHGDLIDLTSASGNFYLKSEVFASLLKSFYYTDSYTSDLVDSFTLGSSFRAYDDLKDSLPDNLMDIMATRRPARAAEEASEPAEAYLASSVTKITSPDTSLEQLVALIQSAKSSVEVELMSFYSYWDDKSVTSPLIEAILDAARRGVQVRVLLNDESVFSGRKYGSKNQVTVDLLNQTAEKEELNLTARIAKLQRMGVTYIHNKGVLVDHNKTLISSINWNQNSVERNREAAVVLVSPSIHDYYLRFFESDWDLSGD